MKRPTYLGNNNNEFIPSIQNPVLSINRGARILCVSVTKRDRVRSLGSVHYLCDKGWMNISGEKKSYMTPLRHMRKQSSPPRPGRQVTYPLLHHGPEEFKWSSIMIRELHSIDVSLGEGRFYVHPSRRRFIF